MKEYQEHLERNNLAQADLSIDLAQMTKQQSEWFERKMDDARIEDEEVAEMSARVVELERQLEIVEKDHLREKNKLRLQNRDKDENIQELRKAYESLKSEKAQRLARRRRGEETGLLSRLMKYMKQEKVIKICQNFS